MKTQLLFFVPLILLSCKNSVKNSAAINSDSTSTTKLANDGVIEINNLDSLNYIFTSKSEEVKQQYIDKTIRLTGSIQDGSFKFFMDDEGGRKKNTDYGIETDLKSSDFTNVIQNQPMIFFYNKAQKKAIEEITTPNSEYKLLSSIYNAYSSSNPNIDINKGIGNVGGNSKSELQREASSSLRTLKANYPGTYTSLMNGDFVVGNYYKGDAPIMDFIVIDEVTIQGKLIDIGLNGLNKLGFKLAGTKVVKTKRLVDLNKLPPFIPNISNSNAKVDPNETPDAVDTIRN